MIANEQWRNSPKRRAAAAELHADWMRAVTAVVGQIGEAATEFDRLHLPASNPTARIITRVSDALDKALRDLASLNREAANETLIGNMAAAGESYWVEDGD